MDGLKGADVQELAIHRRVSKLKYSHRCAEASAVQSPSENAGHPPGTRYGDRLRGEGRQKLGGGAGEECIEV